MTQTLASARPDAVVASSGEAGAVSYTVSLPPTAWHRFLQWADLLRVLAMKNFRQRYLRSRLGVAWALLQPIAQASVMSFVFVKIFKVHRVEHYPLYVLSGIMCWQFFQSAAVGGSTAVVDNAGLVRKVAVPKITFPLSAVGGQLLVLSLQLVVLISGSAIIGTLSEAAPLLLLAVLLAALLSTSVAVLFCSMHVSVRDVRFLLESGLMMAFYLTPVLWDPARLPATYRHFLEWNPMTGVLSLVRAALLERPVDWTAVGITCLVIPALLAVALPLFHRQATDFADLV